MEDLEAAKTLAIRAGAILLEYCSRPSVHWKARGNPVTEADRQVSVFLVHELSELFPEDGILSEEEPGDWNRLHRPRVWIIDPIDGTAEYIRGLDEFAIMIGLSVDGIAALGVVYQPMREKLYYATAGTGAFLVENRSTRMLRVSNESNPAAMTMAVSRSHHSPDVEAIRRELGIGHVITLGSIGLKTGLICEGRAHLYVHTGRHTSEWDTCAPDIILNEAGGRMTDILNAPLRYNKPSVRNAHGVIASNGVIHQEAVKASHLSAAGTSR